VGGLEAPEYIEEPVGDGEAHWLDAQVRREGEELGEPAAARQVGGHVEVAAGVAHAVDGAVARVRGVVLEVQPLHFGVVGAIVGDDLDRGVGVGDEVREAARGGICEDVGGADDAEEFELGDGVASQAIGDGEREEEAVAPAAEAGCHGSFFGRVGVDEEAAGEGGGRVGSERGGGGGVGDGAVAAGGGDERVDPGEGCRVAEGREGHDALGVVAEAAVGLVEAVHD